MARAQKMRAIDEGLLRQEGQRRLVDGDDILAIEARLADIVAGELAIGRAILAQRKHLLKDEVVHFFRKASRATTSPVLAPLSDFFLSSASLGAAGAGGGAEGGIAAVSPGWNCSPNFTDGSVKEIIDSNGMVRRSDRPLKDKVTAK